MGASLVPVSVDAPARPISAPVVSWDAVPLAVSGVPAIAAVVNLPIRTVERAIAMGRIRVRRVGRRVIASKTTLRRFVEGDAR